MGLKGSMGEDIVSNDGERKVSLIIEETDLFLK